MAIDPAAALALVLPETTALVEHGRLRAFAAAIGEDDPIYRDTAAARAAGHPDIPVPPTFLFSLELEAEDPLGYLDQLGVDLRGVLHGEQRFTYHRVVHAGETITCRPRIAEAYAKSPTMDFLVRHADFLCGDELVAEADSLLIARAVVAA